MGFGRTIDRDSLRRASSRHFRFDSQILWILPDLHSHRDRLAELDGQTFRRKRSGSGLYPGYGEYGLAVHSQTFWQIPPRKARLHRPGLMPTI